MQQAKTVREIETRSRSPQHTTRGCPERVTDTRKSVRSKENRATRLELYLDVLV